jgi:phosphoribosylformylglycinamidine synthase subunit PurS
LTVEPKTLNSSGDAVKAKVYVTLKSGVLDPQGKAIQHSVALLGYDGVADVRQGKYFEIALDSGLDEARARATAERLARDVLSNPVIEDFRVEVEG